MKHMASLSTNKKTDERTIQFFNGQRQRKTIRLGKRTTKSADKIRAKVEALVADAIARKSHTSDVARWLNQVEHSDPSLYDKLAAVDLVPARNAGAQVTLADFCDRYIADRSADVKWSTLITYRNAKRNLVDHFGADRLLDSINAAEAEDWKRWLARDKVKDNPTAGGQGLDRETVRQRCRIAKQMFRDAARRRLIDESPFAEMKGLSAKGNRDKDYFVSRDDAAKVLKACPDAEWKLVVALARYGGVRCPSEVLGLRWGDVDWKRGRFVVHSPKTEHHDGKESRIVPIFPELRPYLKKVRDELLKDFDPKQKRLSEQPVITRWNVAEVNLRTRLHAIIRKAGLEPWPKAFVAMRSTWATELREQFPEHVVNAWIGHSQRVAERHYLQVTDAHYDEAATPENAAPALQRFAVGPVSGRTTSQRSSNSSKNCNMVRPDTTKGGRDRTRICDLLHVKQAL